MSVIIRLQNLPLSANAMDIRLFFSGLSIPDGGVHIVGGAEGDAFIAFSSDEDARQGMGLSGRLLKENTIKLLLSSRNEMFKVIEQARLQASGLLPEPAPSNPPPQNVNLSQNLNLNAPSSGQPTQNLGQTNLGQPNLGQNNLGQNMPDGSNLLQNVPNAAPGINIAGFNPMTMPPFAGLKMGHILTSAPPPSNNLQNPQFIMSPFGTPMGFQGPIGMVPNGNLSLLMNSAPNSGTHMQTGVAPNLGMVNAPPQHSQSNLITQQNLQQHGLQSQPMVHSQQQYQNQSISSTSNQSAPPTNMTPPSTQSQHQNTQQQMGNLGINGPFGNALRGQGPSGANGNFPPHFMNQMMMGANNLGGPNNFQQQQQQQQQQRVAQAQVQAQAHAHLQQQAQVVQQQQQQQQGIFRINPNLGPAFDQSIRQQPTPNTNSNSNSNAISNSNNSSGNNSGNNASSEKSGRGRGDNREDLRDTIPDFGKRSGRRRSVTPERGRDKERRSKRSRSRSRDRRRERRSRSRSRTKNSSRKNSSPRASANSDRRNSSPRLSTDKPLCIDLEKDNEKESGSGEPCLLLSNVPNDASYRDIREFINIETRDGRDGIMRNFDERLVYIRLENISDGEKVLRLSGKKFCGSTVKIEGIPLSAWNNALQKFRRPERGEKRETREVCLLIFGLPFDISGMDVATVILDVVPGDAYSDIHVHEEAVDSNNQKHATAYVKFRSATDAERAKSVVESKGRYRAKIGPISELERVRQSVKEESNLIVPPPGMRGGANNEHHPPPDPSIFESVSIMIRNVPNTAVERDIFDFFSDVGLSPTRVKLLTDSNTGARIGKVICEFSDPSQAQKAVIKNGWAFGRNGPPVSVYVLPLRQPRHFGGRPGFGPGPGNFGPNNQPSFGSSGGPAGFGPNGGGPPENPFVAAMHMGGRGGGRGRGGMMGRGGRGGGRHFAQADSTTGEGGGGGPAPGPNIFDRPYCVLGVTNIPFSATMDDIIQFTQEALGTKIFTERVIRRYDDFGRPTGDVRIAFETPFETNRAFEAINNTKFRGRLLECRINDPNEF